MTKFIATAILLAAAGCAAGPVEPPSERLDREYRTGSNIPQRVRSGDEPGLATVDRESAQRQRDLSAVQPTPLSQTAPPRTP
jgi:hypothetical protein